MLNFSNFIQSITDKTVDMNVSLDYTVAHVLREFTICEMILDLDQLEVHPGNRALNEDWVTKLANSFKGDGCTNVNLDTLLVICSDPQIKSKKDIKTRYASFQTAFGDIAIIGMLPGLIIDGQHRFWACLKHFFDDKEHRVWTCRVLSHGMFFINNLEILCTNYFLRGSQSAGLVCACYCQLLQSNPCHSPLRDDSLSKAPPF